jgi:hypothetical protein
MPEADVEIRVNMREQEEYSAQVEYYVLVWRPGDTIPQRYYPSNVRELKSAEALARVLEKGYPRSSIAIATITETRKWHIKKSAELWPE